MQLSARMPEALAYIDAHLGERLTLPGIAGTVDSSAHHFAHAFKRLVGIAPHQYVMQRRLHSAKELLQSTDLPIAEVALAVGCANQSHFSALFHKTTGVTPLSYRQSRRRQQDFDIRLQHGPIA
jgi:AraC family transcriptional regulator